MRIFTMMFMLMATSSCAFSQTALFQKGGRGELETQSFTIERPATLTISAKTDSGAVEEYGSTSVALKKDLDDEIETAEYWTLDLAETKIAKDQKDFRVRVSPGKYFLEIETVGDVSWDVRMIHNPQVDRYKSRQSGKTFAIESDGKLVASAETQEMARKITNLLNAASK